MKKLFLLLFMIFAVVICQASPPPDVGTAVQYEQGYSATIDHTFVAPVVTTRFEAQEVAYIYIGYIYMDASQNSESYMVMNKQDGQLPECKILALYNSDEPDQSVLKPPVATDCLGVKNINKLTIDLQHTNYGYPFTAN